MEERILNYEELCEYFYNKGYISGLEKAKELESIKVDALINVYKVKTLHYDRLLAKEEEQ